MREVFCRLLQVMVASDDDMSPSLQLWDLRNSVSPIREYHGHAKVRTGAGQGWGELRRRVSG